MEKFVHGTLVKIEAAFDAGVVTQAVRLFLQELAVGADVARPVEIVGRIGRFAADFRADRVVVHERRRGPEIDQGHVAQVTPAAVLHPSRRGCRRRGRFLIESEAYSM